MLFDDWSHIARVAVCGVLSYAWLILVLRVSGKRSLSKLNVFDLVVSFALGSVLATTMLSNETTLADGALAFALLAVLQWAVGRATLRWGWAMRLFRSNPRLLLLRGELQRKAMAAERIDEADVCAAVRKAGGGRLDSLYAVVLETDGSFSVIDEDPGDDHAMRDVVGWEGEQAS